MRSAHLFEGNNVGMTQHAVAHRLALHVQVDLGRRRASAPRARLGEAAPPGFWRETQGRGTAQPAHRGAARDVLDGHLLARGQVALQVRHAESAALKVLDLQAPRDRASSLRGPREPHPRPAPATHPLIALGRSQLVGRLHHVCVLRSSAAPDHAEAQRGFPERVLKAHLPVIAPLHARTGAAAVLDAGTAGRPRRTRAGPLELVPYVGACAVRPARGTRRALPLRVGPQRAMGLPR